MNIKDPEVYRLAKALARRTGVSMTEAVRKALREQLIREKEQGPDSVLIAKLTEISDRCAARRVLDPRDDDEILGYDESGVPR